MFYSRYKTWTCNYLSTHVWKMTTHTVRMGFAGFKLLFHSVCMHHIILQWKTLIYRFTSSYNERPLSIETNISTHIYWSKLPTQHSEQCVIFHLLFKQFLPNSAYVYTIISVIKWHQQINSTSKNTSGK